MPLYFFSALAILPMNILFCQITTYIHKSSWGLYFWDSDPLIDRFYQNLSIKGSESQKQRPHELLWMLWFDEKLYDSYDANIVFPPIRPWIVFSVTFESIISKHHFCWLLKYNHSLLIFELSIKGTKIIMKGI